MEQLSRWALQVVLSDIFVIMCIMFLVVGALEYIVPAQKVPGRHYAFNLAYAFVNVSAVVILTTYLSAGAAHAIQSVGLGFIDLRALGFAGLGGSLFAVLVGALIWDFFQYWQHRLEHRSRVLWQQHLLHHCDEYMNVTTGARHHLFEHVLTPIFVSIPTAILFKLPPVTIAMMSIVPYAWTYVAHANINLGFGRFWWLLVSPNYHRVHHSLEAGHIDRNFVQWFPVWDIVFGTACMPRWRASPATGVAGVSVRTLPQAYLLPLRMIADPVSGELSPRAPTAPDAQSHEPDSYGGAPRDPHHTAAN